jgi:MFS transporter, PAT family, beta-lactamase induction signal transducer AmpG
VKPKISAKNILFLGLLYFSQGLPFGFQANALSLYLTELGLSMSQVSFSRLLGLPWVLKFLWAPLVDRFFSERFGKRKSWIVPAQLGLSLTCLLAAFVEPSAHLKLFLFFVLLMNLFAATQDIAVDGLAVDTLSSHELGAGNSAQVVGYKIGMLTGGGLLVALSAHIGGWRGLFFSMAGITFSIAMLVLLTPERPVESQTAPPESGKPKHDWNTIFTHVKSILKRPQTKWFLIAVLTYKMGETMADSMFGPFLLKEHHIEKETVALWLGSWGIVASLLGSTAGGFLATRMPILRAVALGALFRIFPLVLQWLMAAGYFEVQSHSIIAMTIVEHFFGGLLTTAMFAFMMSQVDREIGATHFTILASLEVLGKAPAGILSGLFVDWLGFAPVFLIAAFMSVGFLIVLRKVSGEHASRERQNL